MMLLMSPMVVLSKSAVASKPGGKASPIFPWLEVIAASSKKDKNDNLVKVPIFYRSPLSFDVSWLSLFVVFPFTKDTPDRKEIMLSSDKTVLLFRRSGLSTWNYQFLYDH